MKFARVIGNVVATRKEERVEGKTLLLVQPLNIDFQPSEAPSVAIDAVGAGEGDMVLLVSGSSARQTAATQNQPCDLAVMAIVDTVDRCGEVIYSKAQDRG